MSPSEGGAAPSRDAVASAVSAAAAPAAAPAEENNLDAVGPSNDDQKHQAPSQHQQEAPPPPPLLDHQPSVIKTKRERPPKILDKHYVFNAARCEYDVIHEVVDELGWKSTDNGASNCSLIWIDTAVGIRESFETVKAWQLINHFPGLNDLIARKSRMYRNLHRIARVLPKEYTFLPTTYVLPEDRELLCSREFENGKTRNNRYLILKPDHMAKGKGVQLINSWDTVAEILQEKQMRHQHIVVQRYISHPMLLDGMKFDLRLYLLVTHIDPLELYLFQDGLVRLSTTEYEKPNADNFDQRCMHLTNYAVNKDSENFVMDAGDDGAGSKRSLLWFWKHVDEEYGEKERKLLWKKCKQLCVKMMLAVQPALAHEYYCGMPKDGAKLKTTNRCRCFALLGVDIMVDRNLKPWLLETNHLPSFATETDLDYDIKKRLIEQTLDLIPIVPCALGKKLIGTEEFDDLWKFRKEEGDVNLDQYEKAYPVAEETLAGKVEEQGEPAREEDEDGNVLPEEDEAATSTSASAPAAPAPAASSISKDDLYQETVAGRLLAFSKGFNSGEDEQGASASSSGAEEADERSQHHGEVVDVVVPKSSTGGEDKDTVELSSTTDVSLSTSPTEENSSSSAIDSSSKRSSSANDSSSSKDSKEGSDDSGTSDNEDEEGVVEDAAVAVALTSSSSSSATSATRSVVSTTTTQPVSKTVKGGTLQSGGSSSSSSARPTANSKATTASRSTSSTTSKVAPSSTTAGCSKTEGSRTSTSSTTGAGASAAASSTASAALSRGASGPVSSAPGGRGGVQMQLGGSSSSSSGGSKVLLAGASSASNAADREKENNGNASAAAQTDTKKDLSKRPVWNAGTRNPLNARPKSGTKRKSSMDLRRAAQAVMLANASGVSPCAGGDSIKETAGADLKPKVKKSIFQRYSVIADTVAELYRNQHQRLFGAKRKGDGEETNAGKEFQDGLRGVSGGNNSAAARKNSAADQAKVEGEQEKNADGNAVAADGTTADGAGDGSSSTSANKPKKPVAPPNNTATRAALRLKDLRALKAAAQGRQPVWAAVQDEQTTPGEGPAPGVTIINGDGSTPPPDSRNENLFRNVGTFSRFLDDGAVVTGTAQAQQVDLSSLSGLQEVVSFSAANSSAAGGGPAGGHVGGSSGPSWHYHFAGTSTSTAAAGGASGMQQPAPPGHSGGGGVSTAAPGHQTQIQTQINSETEEEMTTLCNSAVSLLRRTRQQRIAAGGKAVQIRPAVYNMGSDAFGSTDLVPRAGVGSSSDNPLDIARSASVNSLYGVQAVHGGGQAAAHGPRIAPAAEGDSCGAVSASNSIELGPLPRSTTGPSQHGGGGGSASSSSGQYEELPLEQPQQEGGHGQSYPGESSSSFSETDDPSTELHHLQTSHPPPLHAKPLLPSPNNSGTSATSTGGRRGGGIDLRELVANSVSASTSVGGGGGGNYMGKTPLVEDGAVFNISNEIITPAGAGAGPATTGSGSGTGTNTSSSSAGASKTDNSPPRLQTVAEIMHSGPPREREAIRNLPMSLRTLHDRATKRHTRGAVPGYEQRGQGHGQASVPGSTTKEASDAAALGSNDHDDESMLMEKFLSQFTQKRRQELRSAVRRDEAINSQGDVVPSNARPRSGLAMQVLQFDSLAAAAASGSHQSGTAAGRREMRQMLPGEQNLRGHHSTSREKATSLVPTGGDFSGGTLWEFPTASCSSSSSATSAAAGVSSASGPTSSSSSTVPPARTHVSSLHHHQNTSSTASASKEFNALTQVGANCIASAEKPLNPGSTPSTTLASTAAAVMRPLEKDYYNVRKALARSSKPGPSIGLMGDSHSHSSIPCLALDESPVMNPLVATGGTATIGGVTVTTTTGGGVVTTSTFLEPGGVWSKTGGAWGFPANATKRKPVPINLQVRGSNVSPAKERPPLHVPKRPML